MAKKSIGIVGYGVVGRSLHTLFNDDAVTLDADGTAKEHAQINACDVVFICVPTPTGAGGACDTSIVEEVIGWITAPLIVIRSTVTPGTTERLRSKTGKRIVFQPEYIGETVQHPLADVRKSSFIILGGLRDDCSAVADVYNRYYHSHVRFYFTDSRTAEMAKYMENSFFSLKVTFCNVFFDIAKAHGVDYNELREMWLADPRINRDHTFVYPDKRGFSGKCLPKDVSAIIASSHKHGHSPEFLEAVMRANEEYQAASADYAPYLSENRGADAPSTDDEAHLSIVAPAYNEAENISNLVGEISSIAESLDRKWELIIVNDGSDDDSPAILRRMMGECRQLRVLSMARRSGQTAALDAGLRAARGRFIATIDADLQNDPAEILRLLPMVSSGQWDLVNGWRKDRQDTFCRRIFSRVANVARNRLTREQLHDSGCALKVFRRECIGRVKMFRGMHRFLTTLVKMEGFRITEMPVKHRPRVAGAAKYGLWNRVFRATRDALAIRWMQSRTVLCDVEEWQTEDT